MHITAFADTHGYHDKVRLPGGDLLLFAGDWSGKEKGVDEFIAFANWIHRQEYRYKIIVPGNHDAFAAIDEANVRRECAERDIIFAVDELIEVDGLRVYCSPWSPEYGVHSFLVKRGTPMRRVWSRMPDEVDIVLTHTPPFGYGDFVTKPAPGRNVGCVELMNRLRQVHPMLHVFGHCHGAAGQYCGEEDLEGTLFINCSICDGNYEPKNEAVNFNM